MSGIPSHTLTDEFKWYTILKSSDQAAQPSNLKATDYAAIANELESLAAQTPSNSDRLPYEASQALQNYQGLYAKLATQQSEISDEMNRMMTAFESLFQDQSVALVANSPFMTALEGLMAARAGTDPNSRSELDRLRTIIDEQDQSGVYRSHSDVRGEILRLLAVMGMEMREFAVNAAEADTQLQISTQLASAQKDKEAAEAEAKSLTHQGAGSLAGGVLQLGASGASAYALKTENTASRGLEDARRNLTAQQRAPRGEGVERVARAQDLTNAQIRVGDLRRAVNTAEKSGMGAKLAGDGLSSFSQGAANMDAARAKDESAQLGEEAKMLGTAATAMDQRKETLKALIETLGKEMVEAVKDADAKMNEEEIRAKTRTFS